MAKQVLWMGVLLSIQLGCVGVGPANMDDVAETQETSAAEVRSTPAVVFDEGTVTLDWHVVNDTVMGGRSRSAWRTEADAYGIFEGVLSLENNGGFASVRSSDISALRVEHDALLIKVRGDGRPYRLSARTDQVGWGVRYHAEFETEADTWLEIVVPLSAFQAQWRGRRVPRAPALEATDIRSVGFMLADKSPGPFRLDVAHIHSVTNAARPESAN